MYVEILPDDDEDLDKYQENKPGLLSAMKKRRQR